MKKQYLHENWFLTGKRLDARLSASVPGCVHTDLSANGVIGNLFWRDNNRQYQWIEKEDWDYTCTFDADPNGAVTLVFEGLDTYAEITLNGTCLGKVEDMFLPHSFDVSGLLRATDNQLRVHFFSPIRAVEGKPARKGAFTTERINTRRMQCTYQWDWVDRFVTCGIFRPVYLAYANGIDVENVYIYTEHLDAYGAQLHVEMNFLHWEHGGMTHAEILDPDGKCIAETDFYTDLPHMIRRFDIPDPKLWFPNGYGEQPLYRLVLTVGENRFEQTFGIRTLRVMQLTDAEGSEYWHRATEAQATEAGKKYSHNKKFSGFQVVVNGVKIFCRGGNWVPCEPFPSAESDEKLTRLVGLAKEMGANFLRVWGGGILEKPAFYDACDREGILVAQDFMMACGEYPEKEAWFIEALQKEAEHAVKFLRNHPCLAWWHGDNENATRGSDTQEDYKGRDSGLRGLAPQIYRYDPSHVFLPSSPYGGEWYASLTCGTAHTSNHVGRIFDYFNDSDCRDYQTYLEQFVARFISEEATLGAATRPSLLKFMTEDDLLRDDAIWIYHSKGNPDCPRELFYDMSHFAEKLFGTYRDGEDRFFKLKYVQYEWIRQTFENCRSALGYCNGEIFWMFDDCWPSAACWSLVDYYGLPKSSFYCFKRCASPVIGSVKLRDAHYRLTVSNVTAQAKRFTVTARLLDQQNSFMQIDFVRLYDEVSPYGIAQFDLPWTPDERHLVVCDLTYDEGGDRCFFKHGLPLLHPCTEALQVCKRDADSITLYADRYVHAVELEGAYIFEDNDFSLLQGETKTVHFRATEHGDGTDITVCGYTL